MDEDNRFLREFAERMVRLQRILDAQQPAQQGAVQAQFDRTLEQLDRLHSAAVARGFLNPKAQ